MTKRHRRALGRASALLILVAGAALPARAEPSTLRIGVQFGVGYLPIYVAQADGLINKHLAEKSLEPIEVTIQNVAGAPQISDGLLSRTMDIGSGGITAMMVQWDKTRAAGGQAMKGMTALSSMGYELYTVDPGVRTLGDLTETNKIGMTAIKVSIPAIFLQMATAKLYGIAQYKKFDALTVSLAQPDGVVALLSGKGAVDNYIFAPPFIDEVKDRPGVHRVWTSNDIVGSLTALSMWTTARFRDESPVTYNAVIAAVRDAVTVIRRNPRHAAAVFIAAEHSKLPVETVAATLATADKDFDIAPQHSLQLAQFLAETGQLKAKPTDWKDYFFPEIAGEPGS